MALKLKILHGHCCGTALIPSHGTATYHQYTPPPKEGFESYEKIKNGLIFVGRSGEGGKVDYVLLALNSILKEKKNKKPLSLGHLPCKRGKLRVF